MWTKECENVVNECSCVLGQINVSASDSLTIIIHQQQHRRGEPPSDLAPQITLPKEKKVNIL